MAKRYSYKPIFLPCLCLESQRQPRILEPPFSIERSLPVSCQPALLIDEQKMHTGPEFSYHRCSNDSTSVFLRRDSFENCTLIRYGFAVVTMQFADGPSPDNVSSTPRYTLFLFHRLQLLFQRISQVVFSVDVGCFRRLAV